MCLTDEEIRQLIEERKPLPYAWRGRFRLRQKGGSEERILEIAGDAGTRFHLIVRQNVKHTDDFSVVVACEVPGQPALLHLRRYNGKSHTHTNVVEGNHIGFDYHIHQATERYQQRGEKPDGYAELTDRYTGAESALSCAIQDCGFVEPGCEGWEIDETLFGVQESAAPAGGSGYDDH